VKVPEKVKGEDSLSFVHGASCSEGEKGPGKKARGCEGKKSIGKKIERQKHAREGL